MKPFAAPGDAWAGSDTIIDESACPRCLRENCEGCEDDPAPPEPHVGLDPGYLADAVEVARQGQAIADAGIPYVLDGIIPGYGMVGFLIAYAKVGKTTFGQALGAAVAMGRPFLDRTTRPCRVLVIAAEDPPEYAAYLARHLDVDLHRMTFYRGPLLLDPDGLRRILTTVREGGYGLVLISSWQACVRGLVRDENDNANGVLVVENVKGVARETGIPWLIDAHSGKGEDHTDDADPTRALRGASAAAGAADYLLSLRYAESPFNSQRRLSGKGRFVNLPPITLDFDLVTNTYTSRGSTKDAFLDTTWQLIAEIGALDDTPRTLGDIARACGMAGKDGKVSGAKRRQVASVLAKRPDVGKVDELVKGQKVTRYRRL